MQQNQNVTLVYGDGVGTEVISATRRVIDATGARIAWEVCTAGSEAFRKGLASGVPQETLDSIARNRVALKGPLETPIGYGEKSANVTLRKLFETFGNIRPVTSLPGIITPFSDRQIDLVIVRENVEDLYTGIEHMQTHTTAQCLKLISRSGCEKIVRLAFEVARTQGRKSVHCATKSNILKMTEGMMQRVFEEIAPEYPDIQAHHLLVDNCAHQLVRFPESFETLVMTNMNGDILSDLASGLVGGLGFAPGANLGHDIAIFEAVHGAAPQIAGRNVVNPIAVMLSGVMMLRHLGEFTAADLIEQSLHYTVGVQKILTPDAAPQGQGVSTTAFTDAVIDHFGKAMPGWKSRTHQPIVLHAPAPSVHASTPPTVVGVDIFLCTPEAPHIMGPTLEAAIATTPFVLKSLSSRGVMTYPAATVTPAAGDHHCARFMLQEGAHAFEMAPLLACIETHYPWTHIEKLNVFGGVQGFSQAQGEP